MILVIIGIVLLVFGGIVVTVWNMVTKNDPFVDHVEESWEDWR